MQVLYDTSLPTTCYIIMEPKTPASIAAADRHSEFMPAAAPVLAEVLGAEEVL